MRLGVAPEEKFEVIRLGIELGERVGGGADVARETRRQLGVAPDAFVVGWVGRMTAVKRTDDVLLAFRSSLDRGVDAWLCLVGDGPDRDHLEQRAHELGIVRRCLFLGYQDDVAPYYDGDRRAAAPVGERGDAGQRDRGARGRAARRSRPASAACRTSSATASTASSSTSATQQRSPTAWPSSRATPRAAPRWARPAASASSSATPSSRLVDDVDRLYRELLDASPR